MYEDEGEGKQEEEGEDKPVRGKTEEEEEGGGQGEGEEETDEEPPPPPPEQEKELLFLIEFLVDTLTLKPENIDVANIDPCALQGPNRLALTFLHFPPMLLNEKDMDPDRMTGSDVVQFNSGKSLMFALTESQFEDPPAVYLAVEASKEMPHAFRFPFIAIGKTKIQLSELFKQVFTKYDENPGKTVSKSVKDSYELIGDKGKVSAEVTIYIRLTCLGQNIVTEFAKAEDLLDTVLFKNKESKRVYQCKETIKQEDEPGRRLPGWGDQSGPKACWERQQSGRQSQPDPDDENFEEIFAEINGSAIVVKVEKSGRKPKPKSFHVSEFCDCNIPLPQDLVAGLSDLSLSPASEGYLNLESGGPVQTDKRVGIDSANQLTFQVPPIETISQPGTQKSITYNVKTCSEGAEHGHKGRNSFRVFTDNSPDGGPPPKMPNDPEKDVFVLRIIKRGRKDKAKDVLELEFKIPKEKIEPPPKPPYMVERSVGQDKKKDKKKKKA